MTTTIDPVHTARDTAHNGHATPPGSPATAGSPPATGFADRHIGPAGPDVAAMLQVIGTPSLEALLDAAMPAAVRSDQPLGLPAAADEAEVLAELRELAARNTLAVPMIGLGYYGTHTPGVIRRNVLEDPAWYTAYTPYQPEISQGRLEALLTFQTVIEDLTGLPVANASLLDEATAAAEAVALMRRAAPKGDQGVLVIDTDLFPQTAAVLRTRAEPAGTVVVEADLGGALPVGGSAEEAEARVGAALDAAAAGRPVFGVLAQYPAGCGAVRDLEPLVAAAHRRDALVTVAADLLALTLLRPPGEAGADVVVGTSQRFGVPLGYGGPHAGYLAVRAGLERTVPGRLVGVSRDADGRPAYRLALQTREQHIRRERATSNICTAQVLLAVAAAMYAVYHGPAGLRAIAARVAGHAAELAGALRAGGVEVANEAFFDTVLARVPGRADDVIARAGERGILLRRVDGDRVAVACDETTTPGHLAAVCAAFGVAAPGPQAGGAEVPPAAVLEPELPASLPAGLRRTSAYLTNPVFARHRSETAMLRYLRRLADADYALDRKMIPLGSCTMKLNATTEMKPITWPTFAELHPFAPPEHTANTHTLIADLQS